MERLDLQNQQGHCPLHVLLVEDNPLYQLVTGYLLKRRGHTFVTVEDGLNALETLTKQSFDMVVMDLGTAIKNGRDIVSVIREVEKTTGDHLPIIGLVAEGAAGKERDLAPGIDHYIAKPVKPEDFDAAIARLTPP